MSEIEDGMSPMPLLPITSAETLRNCKKSIRPHDIFVCSYPKSGTTWMQNIVFQLMTKGEVPLTHISDFLPFYEVDRTWEGGEVSPRYARGHGLLGRRCFNTHLRWSLLPTEGSGSETTRFIYVVRHGKDVCTSYYHHMKSMAPEDGGFDGTWDEFCSAFCEGAVAFGSWCDHLVSCIGGAAFKDDRVLILRYEEMKSDLRRCAERVARHIGAQLTLDEMEEAVGRMSFDYMKQHAESFNPRSVEWTDRSFEFIRRGVVGDHRSLFTPQQHTMFEEMIKRRFGSDVPEYILNALKEEG